MCTQSGVCCVVSWSLTAVVKVLVCIISIVQRANEPVVSDPENDTDLCGCFPVFLDPITRFNHTKRYQHHSGDYQCKHSLKFRLPIFM